MENAFRATEQIVFPVGGCWNLKLVSVSFEASKSLGDPPIILWNIVPPCFCYLTPLVLAYFSVAFGRHLMLLPSQDIIL